MGMRRKDRELSLQEAWAILEQGIYGVLATANQDGQPHGTPISYVADKENNSIYFHCAKTGQKTQNMEQNAKMCFTVVTQANPVFIPDPLNYTVYYTSAMAYGHVQRLSDGDKKRAAMTLVSKYFPENAKAADGYYESAGAYIDVWQITIDSVTAKSHQRP